MKGEDSEYSNINPDNLELTYKENLFTEKPYHVAGINSYYSMLQSRKDAIYHGQLGIYLGRKIKFHEQELYFPFIDVDGEKSAHENEVINDAIYRTKLTMNILNNLGVGQHFFPIASGNTGFRIGSNLLLKRSDYLAFVDFIKQEMTHIIDLKPTEELEMPHQLLVYKGDKGHNQKVLVDRHSKFISWETIRYGMNPDFYKRQTSGKLDPDEVLAFLKVFFQFKPIAELKALGLFGKKLQEFKDVDKALQLKTFDITRRPKSTPLSLAALSQELLKKKILHKIEDRGGRLAISFKGFTCPSCCGKRGNAGAYPPHFRLHCFDAHCEAYKKGGLPLHMWAAIKQDYRPVSQISDDQKLIPQAPINFSTIEEAQEVIKQELENRNDVLLLITPGVGKTHVTLEYLVNNIGEKTVIYSCFNRSLKEEAYKKATSLNPTATNLFLLKAKEECCLNKTRLSEVTNAGFSPSLILCPACEHSKECPYYQDRNSKASGIYFVTHHMLQYLKEKIPTPDMIILDENLIGGFRLEDSLTESQMKSLYRLLDRSGIRFLDQILAIAHGLSKQIIKDGLHPQILNALKLTNDNYPEDYLIGVLAKQNEVSEDEIINQAEQLVSSLTNIPESKLFEKGINLKAINWLRGLIHPRLSSYLLITEKGDIFFNVKYISPMPYNSTPIKVLDATGNRQVVDSLFKKDFREVKIDVKWPSKSIHIKRSSSRSVMELIKDKYLIELIQKALHQVTAQNILLVTYKFLTARVKKICENLEPDKNFHIHHFQGPRGINTFEICDAVIVIGYPYPNINSSWQDAHILFPGEKNTEIRDFWIEAITQWEIIQVIHRIRPVRKSHSELVIISNSWPNALPEPTEIIDLSHNMNWKGLAIQHLEPFVREFGFLNQDIAFLAGVSIKQKETTSKKLIEKFNSILPILKQIEKYSNQSSLLEDCQAYFEPDKRLGVGDTSYISNLTNLKQKITKLILVIYMLYIKNKLALNSFIKKIAKVMHPESEGLRLSEMVINISSPNHWSELMCAFKLKYPYFEEFKIRLPHSRNNFVNGVGRKDSVEDFYANLFQLGIIGKVDLTSYTRLGEEPVKIEPIPEGYLTVFIPENESGLGYFGYGNRRETFSVSKELRLPEVIVDLLSGDNYCIITNNNKWLAKKILQNGLEYKNIHDVMLNEKIIANGQIPSNFSSFNDLLERYHGEVVEDHILVMNQMFRIWQTQQETIDRDGLRGVVELENKALWVVAKIELRGIKVDGDRLGDFLIECEDEPESSDSNRFNQSAERLWENVGVNDRIYVSANQLGTVTGRITCNILQTMPKEGGLRSFIIPDEGYKFIIADYSQFEARIALGLSQDKNGLAIFQGGKDIYLEFAKVIAGSENEPGDYRKVAKGIVLGLLNGKTEYSIQEDLSKAGINYTLDAVMVLIFKFNQYFSALKTWQDRVIGKAREDGYARTALGRRRYLDKILGEKDVANKMRNFPITGTGSDGFKTALCQLDRKFGELGIDAGIVLTMHDEIIVETREEFAEEVQGIIKECLETAFKRIIPEMPFDLDIRIANSWGIK